MPQPPRPIELETAPILLGVNHEHPTRPDHQVIEVGPAARQGQVVQDRPPVPLQRAEQPGGASLPHRPASPGDGVRAGPESQPPAGHHGHQPAEEQPPPVSQLAAQDSPTDTDAEDEGDPPGQGPDQAAHSAARSRRQVARAEPPGRSAHAGSDPHRHHRPIGVGAGQQLVGVLAEVGENRLQVGLS
jgi:hypothetical protein